jgi:hypothetical protein
VATTKNLAPRCKAMTTAVENGGAARVPADAGRRLAQGRSGSASRG